MRSWCYVDRTVNVNYATANGTGTLADNDYQSATGTLTFNPGDLSKTITVLVHGDQDSELGNYWTKIEARAIADPSKAL